MSLTCCMPSRARGSAWADSVIKGEVTLTSVPRLQQMCIPMLPTDLSWKFLSLIETKS